MKRFLFFNIILLLMFFKVVFANSNVSTEEYNLNNISFVSFNPDEEIVPFVVDACPGRGSHTMISKVWGKLIEVDRYGNRRTIFNGAAWQCKYCNEVLVTEFDPLLTGYVGKYCMRSRWDVSSLSDIGTIMEAPSESIRFTNGATVPNCHLYY
ncbi:hypothetical protein [Peptoniphilus asaccharolyticus]